MTEPDPQGRTIGEAKEELAHFDERIEALEGHVPDEHIDTLRANRDDLRRDVEYSMDHARAESAVNNLLRSLARSTDD